MATPATTVAPVELVSYFGPTTMVYSVALGRVAPQLRPQGWNKGTRGDICKSRMGFVHLVQRGRLRGDLRTTKHAGGINDGVRWMVDRLHANTGNDLVVWVRWITDTDAWRKDALGGEEEREATHQILVLVCDDIYPVDGPRYNVGAFRPVLEVRSLRWFGITPRRAQKVAGGHCVQTSADKLTLPALLGIGPAEPLLLSSVDNSRARWFTSVGHT